MQRLLFSSIIGLRSIQELCVTGGFELRRGLLGSKRAVLSPVEGVISLKHYVLQTISKNPQNQLYYRHATLHIKRSINRSLRQWKDNHQEKIPLKNSPRMQMLVCRMI